MKISPIPGKENREGKTKNADIFRRTLQYVTFLFLTPFIPHLYLAHSTAIVVGFVSV
jgi:hypothetical protein